MIRFLLTLSMILSPAWSQDNIQQRVFSLRTPTSGVSSPIRNVGQSQHLIWYQFSDSGGVCNVTTARVFLEGSFDGVNYFALTPRVTTLEDRIGQGLATGTFFALRVNSAIDVFACALTVYYSGGKAPAPFPQSVRTVASGYSWARVSTPGPSAFVVNVLNGSTERVVVYGAWINNTVAAANTGRIFPCDGAGLASGTDIGTFNLGNGGPPVILPTSVVPYGAGFAGLNLCVSTTAGTAEFHVVYRIE
jgi:hypothetical protein